MLMQIVHPPLGVRLALPLRILVVLLMGLGFFFIHADVASADCHDTTTPTTVKGATTTTLRRGGAAADKVCREITTGTFQETSFLDTPIGKTLRNVAKIGGIALALWGVVKAASKGFGREGGGIGAFAKGLVVPMIAAAFLYNLQWAFTLLGWAISIVGDLFSLIGDAF